MKTEQKTVPAALRRGIAFLCTLVLSLMAVTLPAEAAPISGLTDSNIELNSGTFNEGTSPFWASNPKESSERYSWKAIDGRTIEGTVTPKEIYGWKISSSGRRYQCYQGASYDLSIRNRSDKTCILSFTYEEPENGTLSFYPEEGANNGVYSARLDPNDTVTVKLMTASETKEDKNSSTQNQYTVTTTLSDINLEPLDEKVSVTLLLATNGSYTARAGDAILQMDNTYNVPRHTEYTFSAVPDTDCSFVGWYVDGQRRSSKLEFTTVFNDISESYTVEARFVRKGVALFETGGQPFDDLDEAVAYAQANNLDKITLASDGKITGHYMIPAGITLLIPFDEAETLYAAKPESMKDYVTPSVFRKLTMEPGSSITVDGAISVGGKHCHTMGNLGPSGPYGQIDMAAGSSITLNNGANLYAWGYITGDGQITATSGAAVYEYFQVKDWRGGWATTKMLDNGEKVFPLSQYYVQNIEAALTLEAGAAERTYISISVSIPVIGNVTRTAMIDFIGSDESLFRLGNEGSLTKKYDPKTDRVTYTTTGLASLDSLALGISGYNIDSKKYVLPVSNNMTLNILSGSVAVNSDAALLPGAQVVIAQGAELNVKPNVSLYVYDYDEWGKYCHGDKEFVPVNYSPSGKENRTLTDAMIDVNGTLTAAGSVYTTKSGANICSSEGGGRFVLQNEPDNKSTTHQATQKGSDVSYDDIPITAAKLHNLDNSYTETNNTVAKAGDTFTYCTGSECGGGKWVQNLQVAAIIDSIGTQTPYPTLQKAVDAYTPDDNTAPKNYIKLLHSTTEKITAKNDLYLDLNGCTVTGDFKMGNNTLYGMDSSAEGYNTPPKGKIVGSVVPYAKTTYQTPPTENGEYDRYVAILGAEADGTTNLSFHRFNISVTGYRFELTSGDTPKCALFFIGKFRGDDAAKKHLKSLGFTLTGGNGTGPKEFSCEMPQALGNEVFSDKDGAFLFEVYLKRSFGKDASAASFTEGISATAKATFQNQGVLGEQLSNERTLSFKEAWEKADNLDPAQKAIIDKILREHGINQ